MGNWGNKLDLDWRVLAQLGTYAVCDCMKPFDSYVKFVLEWLI